MSSRTTICIPAEVMAVLGLAGTASQADRGLIEMLMNMVDSSIKTFLGWSVIYQQYTHLLPDVDLYNVAAYGNAWPYGEPFDVMNGRIAMSYGGIPDIIQVPEIPLRSITSMKVDYAAAGGQASSNFSAATQLTLGTDYYVQYDAPDIGQVVPYQSGVCWAGHIRRWLGGIWPARAQTCLVQYYAGVTPDELDGVVSFPSRRITSIKQAAMLATMLAYKEIKAWGGGSSGTSGPVIAERLADYSVTYSEAAINAAVGMMGELPFKVQNLLRPFQRIRR